MPGNEIQLTGHPIRLAQAGAQALNLAVDVSNYDAADFLLSLLNVDTSSTGVVVTIETAMQNDSDDGWVTLATFSTLTTANSFDAQSVTSGLLKYIRWNVTGLGGANSITFQISGMLRARS